MKVLVVTYYWPPAGGPGVQRWLKFVKYLPQYGIEPVIFIPENPNYPILDNNILNEIPEDVEIIKQPIFEPYKFANMFSRKKTKQLSSGIFQDKEPSFIGKLLLYIRGNFFIPDARKYWVKPSVKSIVKYVNENPVDAIITTGPPHSVHLIGMKIKEQLGLRWIADFRDPWTTIGYHNKLRLTKKSADIHRKLEFDVLNNADNIIVTSPSTKEEFSEITNQPIAVITNGYDDFVVGEKVMSKKFSIAHIGSLLSGRNPIMLWKALSSLINEITGFSDDLEITLVGTVSDNVIQSMTDLKLGQYINDLGYVSHDKARKLQFESQILLLVEIDASYTKCIIPGKLFEYMQTERPILGIGPEGADFKRIIQETNSGKAFDYGDYDEIKSTILDWYKTYKNGQLKANPIGLKKYHRSLLTGELSSLIKK